MRHEHENLLPDEYSKDEHSRDIVCARRLLLISSLIMTMFVAGSESQNLAYAKQAHPQTILHPEVDYPIWVSASLAETPGALDSPLFHPIAALRIHGIFDGTPVHGCYPLGPIIDDRYGARPAPKSLDEAARAYPVIALGKIKELSPGFLVGEAGTLVRAETDADSINATTSTTFYVFIPIGEFYFHGERICKDDPRYAGLPKIGDEILLFSEPPSNRKMQTLSSPLKRLDLQLLANRSKEIDVQYFTLEYPENLILVSGDHVAYPTSFLESGPEKNENPSNRDDLFLFLRSIRDQKR